MKKRFSFLLMAFFLAISSFAQTDCTKQIPWTTDFETDSLTCWTTLQSSGDNAFPKLVGVSSVCHSGSYALEFRDANCMIALPAFEEGTTLSNLRVKFYYYMTTSYNSGTLTVGVMSDLSDTSTFTPIQTITPQSSYTLVSVSLENAPADAQYIALKHTSVSWSTSWYVDDLTVETLPGCSGIDASSLASSNVTSSSADISFTDSNDTHSSWNVYYRASGESTWTLTTTTETSFTLDELNSATTYQLYVAVDCGDGSQSDPSNTITFKTQCGEGWSLPYSNNFDNSGQTDLDCWTKVLTSTSGDFPNLVEHQPSSYSPMHALEFKISNCIIALPSPNDDVDLSNTRLKFYFRSNTSQPGTLEVGVMSDLSDTSTFTSIQSLPSGEGSFHSSTTGYGWQFASISLAGLNGTEGDHIAFRYTSVYSNNSWYIDNFVIEELPSCAGVNYSSVNVTDVTENSATIHFSDPDANHNSWNIYYRPVGSTDDWIVADASDTFYELTGLSTATAYNVFVLTDCGSEEAVDTSIVVKFTTTAVPAEVPFTTDFAEETTYSGYFNNSSDNATCGWQIGSAAGTETDSPSALYISNDNGATESLASGTINAYSVLTLQFGDEAEQTISFDYMSHATNTYYGGLYVYLVPAGTEIPTSGAPSNATALLSTPTNANSSWQHLSYTANNLANTTQQLVFRWYSGTYFSNYGSDNSGKAASIDNISVTASDCAKPSNLAAVDSATTAESITITWHQSGTVDSWNVYYRLQGSTEWDGPENIAYNEDDTMATISGLEGDSYYEIRVTAICNGDETADNGYITIHTACVAVTVSEDAHYTKNFENSSDADCFVSVYGNEPNVENGYLQLNAGYSYSTGGNTMMFTLPQFTNDINTLRIAFDVSRPYTWYDFGTLVVGVMSDPTDSTTFEAINTVTTTSTTGEHFVIPFNLTNIVTGENNYIAFKYTQGGYNAGRMDNVTVSLIPNCMGPDYASGSVSNITNNSATFSFTDSDTTHSSWNVYYSDGTTTNNVETDSTTITLTGLTAGTSYTVWAKTDCGSEESEDSTTVVGFATQGDPITTLPYTQDFEGDNITEFSITGTGVNQWIIGSATGNSTDSTGETHAIYVSNNNGISNAYTNTATSESYATIQVTFADAAEYHLQFDYKVRGENNYDYLSVYVVDPNTDYSTMTSNQTALLHRAALQSEWQSVDYTLTDVQNTTKNIVFYWKNDYSGGSNPPAAVDNISIIAKNCAQPTNLRVETTSETSATLAWHQSGESANWTLYYRQVAAAGDAEQTWTAITATDTTYTITGLTNNTQYEAYVVANCTDEDTSTATSTINFYTTPVLINVGDSYTQDFSDTTLMSSLVGENTATDHWTIGVGPYAETEDATNQALYITDDSLGTYHYTYNSSSDSYIAFPLQFGNKVEYQISFDYKVGGNYYAYCYAYLVPASEVLSSNLNNATTLLNQTYGVEDWTTYSYTLQHASNKAYYLMLRWRNYGYTWYGDGNPPIAIDNLSIVGSDCAQPTDLVVDSVTDESAYLSWTENGNSDNWTLHYSLVPGGADQTVTSGMIKDENNKVTLTLTGLMAGAQYSAYVVSNCTENSNPSNSADFSTLGEMVTEFPFYLSFEDSTENNVFNYTGTGNNQWYIGPALGVEDVESIDSYHSMYISSDNGATNDYTTNTSHAYATMNVQFGSDDEYTLEFDYLVGGRLTVDNLNVYLIPNGTTIPTSGNPTGGTQLMNQSFGVQDWKHMVYHFSGVAGQIYQIVFYWKNTNSYVTLPGAAIDNIQITGSDCYAPTNLRATQTTENSMTLRWTDNTESDNTTWTVSYRVQDDIFSDFTEVVVTDSTATLTGLSTGTDYIIKVVANCDGDEENPSGIAYLRQSTQCSFEISENSGWFDGFSISDNPENRMIPKCWTRLVTSPNTEETGVPTYFPSVITFANTGYQLDETSLEFDYNGTIATPAFGSNIEDLSFSFYACRETNAAGYLNIYVASDIYDTNTWEPIWLNERDSIPKTQNYNTTFNYKQFVIPLNNVINKGQGRHIILERPATSMAPWYFDNFRVMYVGQGNFDETCDNNLTITVDSATTDEDGMLVVPDSTSATISWTTTGPEKSWDYKVSLAGKFVNTTEHNGTFTNLIPGTEYTAYVRARCVNINPIYGDDSTTVVGYDTVEVWNKYSPWDSVTFMTSGESPLDCPEVSGIVVDSVSEHTVTVSWTGSDNAVGYRVAISTLGSYQYLQASDIQSTTNTSYTFSGLTDTTEYTVYVYAVCQYNNSGWDSIAATTLKQYVPAAVTTNAATNIDSTSVTLNGHVNANSDVISTRGFKLKKYTETDLQAQTLVSTDAASNFTYDATGLESQTQYSYKAYVTTDAGNTIEGAWETFTTLAWIPNAPVVVTDSLTNIDSTSATFNASMTLGDEAVTSKGFAYKTVGGTETRVTVSGDNFTYNVTGLAPYTNYEVYAWARTATYNTNTTEARGAVVSFTTLASATTIIPPTVTTLAVSNLDSTSVTFNGAVEQQTESILSKGFVYRVNNATDSTIRTVVGEEFSYNEIDLLPSTNYVVYAYATTASGTTRGANVMFTTLAAPIVAPTVTTLPAENVDSTTASLRGTIVQGSEAIIARGFKYWSQTDSNMVMTANATGLNMTANISNLTPSTTYVYYAYVITATDTTKGANVMFTTNQGVIVNPTVVTLMATNIGQTSATINGQVSGGNQTITDQGFVYRVSGATDSVKAQATGNPMSLLINNLSCGTEYTYYAYATTENGETITGENRTFTTNECDITAPTVTTLSASEISDHNATLNGQVTVGSEEILEQGFEYKESTASSWQTIAANDNFTATINNLTSGTTYTFRAYVTTATDTYRGSDMTFTTTSGLLDVTDNVIISAYPNPTISDVTLKIEGLTEEAQIILTDVQGKTISEQRLPVNQTTMTISTNGLSSGVYYIRVITDNMTRVEKLIKR